MGKFSTILKLLFHPGLAGGCGYVEEFERVFSQMVLGNESLPALGFWRGRVALWTIIKALDLAHGDEVVLPAYTCEMVPIALKFAGVNCVYADVDSNKFNASLDSIAGAITDRTRVLLCQHTYGIAQPIREIMPLASSRQIRIIEDCCQLISAGACNDGVGTNGMASFFSTQWNKPFSTGLGGIAVFNDPQVYASGKDILASFQHKNQSKRAFMLTMQILLYASLIRPGTRAMLAAIYRRSQRLGLVRGTNTMEEYGCVMPADYLAAATNVQATIGLEQLRKWPENIRHRQKLTAFYLEQLSAMDVNVEPLMAGSQKPVLWAVPLLVENKHEILKLAGKHGLPIGTWFDRIPVHINPDTAGRYDYQPGQCPQSERMFTREIHLVTAPWVTGNLAERAVQFIKKYANIGSYQKKPAS